MTHDEWMQEVFKTIHDNTQQSVLTEVTKQYLAKRTPLLNAMPILRGDQFKQEYNGTMEDEGIDLREVPMCPRCGLEVANKYEHELWHQQQQAELNRLQSQIDSLTQSLANILANQSPQPSVFPRNKWVEPKTYISDEEVRKYSSNPFKYTPKPKSGEKW